MHLIKAVHQEGEGFVVKDEQKYNRTFFKANSAIDKGNWAVFHFCCSHGLSMNVV